MRAVLLAAALAFALSGCSGLTPDRMQFSGAAIPFPENYQREAALAVTEAGGTLATAQVTRPQLTIGDSPFGPRLWYACIRGLPAPAQDAKRLPNVEGAVNGLLGNARGSYDTVAFFSAPGRKPSIKSGFDSPLCRDGLYEPIAAR